MVTMWLWWVCCYGCYVTLMSMLLWLLCDIEEYVAMSTLLCDIDEYVAMVAMWHWWVCCYGYYVTLISFVAMVIKLHWLVVLLMVTVTLMSMLLWTGLGFYRVERYFYPTMDRNMGKNGRNTFLPGRNGRNMVETSSTSIMTHFQWFCISLIL